MAFRIVYFHDMAVPKGFKTIYTSVVLSYGEPDVRVMHNMYLYIFIDFN